MKRTAPRTRRLGFNDEARRYRIPEPERQFVAPPRVANCDTLDDLVEHARKEGATHVAVDGSGGSEMAWIFFPTGDPQYPYEEARARRRGGYWHYEGPGERDKVRKLLSSTKTIEKWQEDRRSRRAPSMRETTHHVADFNSLDDLIGHAQRELGATHVSGDGANTQLYFPRGGQHPYEAATVWRKGGYWHAQGPGARSGVTRLPQGAQPIAGGHQRAAEARPSGRMTLGQAKSQLAQHGMTIIKTEAGDYRVRPRGARGDDEGYFTDDLDDAVRTGIHMASRGRTAETSHRSVYGPHGRGGR